MKDDMPTLKEIFNDDRYNLQEFTFQFIMMYSAGYTAEDFKAFAEEILTDKDIKEVVETTMPLFKFGLKMAKEIAK